MADEWRVGVLFSRSGVTEVTESEHFFGTALAVEEINAAGGILGKQIATVAYDPGGDTVAYRNLARRMLTDDDVSIIFGGSMSASRKAILPIVERHNGLLFYPSMYEGFEYSENVVYTGATLNQNTFALAEYLLRKHGPRILFVGADYIYPRESNRVMRDALEAKGGEVVSERYIAIDADEETLKSVMIDIARLKPDAIFSTIVGRAAQKFYRMYADVGIDRSRVPIASLTMAETEIREIGASYCAGHILSATYFQTVDTMANDHFVRAFKARFGNEVTTSVWSQPAYVQVHLFARALARAGSLDAHRISEVLPADVNTIFLHTEEINVEHALQVMEQRQSAIIAVVTYESPTSLQAIIDLNAHGVINKPLRPLGILTQFSLARYRHSYEMRLAGKVQKLEETLKGRRLVDRAIAALCAMNGLDEEAAYKLLRDQATTKRVSMASVAESILAAQEILKSLGLSVSAKTE